ncbi:MAG: short subunit dehydrogenase-like uncharacterized protein [Chitinophagales bacterium]|jgi:short subunit dehydrogenase-like uncharacterized protein
MTNEREYGIVVYGATGYTGRLVAEYLNLQYGVGGEVNWAMAGRSMAKLEAVRDEMGIGKDIPLVVADADDHASIEAMVNNTKVIITTVGPYQLYGSDLVAACAKAGTDYVDLCGEPNWMHEMIPLHSAAAKASGARIVFSCGFDSVPFDLGVYFLQQAAQEKFGKPFARVKGRVRAMNGTFSGGTLASFKETMAAVQKDPSLFSVLVNPFALAEGFTGADQPTGMDVEYDEGIGSWAAPFVMATINTKNIHRSNLLLGHQYGQDFVYDEMMLTGAGEEGETIAKMVASDTSMMTDKTQPGEGPTKDERENGSYDVMFVGSNESGESLIAGVKGDKDPGYGSTSKMIAESAVCLLLNPNEGEGGITTPAPAMGEKLIARLQQNAGISFEIE